MKHLFEAVVIFSIKPPLDEINSRIDDYKHIIQSYSKEKKVRMEDMGEKTLAYEIKKEKKGRYVLYYFEAEDTDISDLELTLRADERTIKFMTMKVGEDEVEDLEDLTEEVAATVSEQDVISNPNSQIDAIDVLLGLAEYSSKSEQESLAAAAKTK